MTTATAIRQTPFAELAIEELRIPLEYQPAHRAEDGITQGIIDDFDPEGLGVLLVSYRDGVYWVLDGQRRLAACKAVGYDRPLPCYVFHGLTLQRETQLWKVLDRRGNQHIVDLYRGMVLAKSPKVAVDIDRELRKHGYQVDYSYGPTTISGVKVLEVLYHWGSLPTVLTIIRSAWQGADYATKPEILMGLGGFDHFYRDAYEEIDFISALRSHDPQLLLQQAQAWRTEGRPGIGRSLWATVAVKFQTLYNAEMNRLGMGRAYRLPEFRQPALPNDKLEIARPNRGKRKAT